MILSRAENPVDDFSCLTVLVFVLQNVADGRARGKGGLVSVVPVWLPEVGFKR